MFTNNVSNLPYDSEGTVPDGAVGLHVLRDGRRLVVGRRCRQDGSLAGARRSTLHQRHGDTHGDARVPRGAAHRRHPPVRDRQEPSPHHHADLAHGDTCTSTLTTQNRSRHCSLLYYSCSRATRCGKHFSHKNNVSLT